MTPGRRLLAALALGAVVCLAFGAVGGHAFLSYDDPDYVSRNPHIASGLTSSGIVWAFTTNHASNYWHPLTWLSHMLDVEMFGLDPRGHHATSLVLHALNGALLFLALAAMTRAAGRSFVVAALFALHPLHVESFAWIAERKDVLAGLFWMLSLLAYARWVERGGAGRYLLLLAAFLLGLLAKPMVVTLPFALILLDLWPLGRMRMSAASAERRGDDPGDPIRAQRMAAQGARRAPSRRPAAGAPAEALRRPDPAPASRPPASRPPRRGRATTATAAARGGPPTASAGTIPRLFAEKAPLFALSALCVLIQIAVHPQGAIVSLQKLTLGERVSNSLMSYAVYLWRMLWPSRLAVFYPHPGIPPPAVMAASFLVLAGVSALVVLLGQRRPYLVFGWLWFLGTLIPVIGWIQVGSQASADRYTYLPLIGPLVMLVWGVSDLAAGVPALRKALPPAAAALLALTAVAGNRQLAYWKTSTTLFEHALSVTANNWLAHFAYGNELRLQGRLPEASAHYTEALRIRPDLAQAHNNLGMNLLQEGKPAEAEVHFESALAVLPDDPEAVLNLAFARYGQGKLAGAIEACNRALALNPRFAAALNNLAWIRATAGEERFRDGAQALRLAEEACAASGHSDARFLATLAAAYAQNGRFAEALQWLDRATALARSSGQTSMVQEYETYRRVYAAGRPLRSR